MEGHVYRLLNGLSVVLFIWNHCLASLYDGIIDGDFAGSV